MAKYLATSPEHVQAKHPKHSFGARLLGIRRARAIGWTGVTTILVGSLVTAVVMRSIGFI